MWTIGSGRVVEADVVTRPTFALLLAHSCSTTCFTFALLSAYFCTTFEMLLFLLSYFCYVFVSSCVWIVSSCIFWILGTMCHLWVPVLVVFSLFLQIQVEYLGCIISHILDNGCWVGFGSWCTVTLTHPSSGTMSRRAKTHLIMTILGGDSSSKTFTICLLLCFYSENIVSVCVCLSVIGGLEGWGV